MYPNSRSKTWCDVLCKGPKLGPRLKPSDNSYSFVMQRGRVEAESVTHKYYNSSTKPKFYKNTRLIGKIIEKTSLTNFY